MTSDINIKVVKKLVATKTVWSGIAAISLGVVLCIDGNYSEGLQSIIGGFGLIFVRHALDKKETENK